MAIISIPTSVAGVALPGELGNLAKGPLNALYQGAGVETLKYPADLATDPTKSHYVQFSVKEIVPAGFSSTNGIIPGQTVGLGNIGSGIKTATSALAESLKPTDPPPSGSDPIANYASAAVNEVANLTRSALNSIGINSENVSSVGNGFASLIEKGLTISPQTTLPRAVISLYMPDTLTASYDSSYTEMGLGDLGSGVNTIRQINQVAGTLGKGNFDSIGGALSAAINTISTDPAVISLATTAADKSGLAGKVGVNAEALGTLLLKGQGYAINPQLQMIYQGIDLRNFSLSFVFTPKSADDSAQIDAIIKTLKYHFAPSLQAGAQTSSDSMYLVPPSIFGVSFKINGVENQYLPKYGDCVLKNIEVNYAPNGWAAHDSGAPVQTTLSLQFQEIQIMDKQKISDGTLR